MVDWQGCTSTHSRFFDRVLGKTASPIDSFVPQTEQEFKLFNLAIPIRMPLAEVNFAGKMRKALSRRLSHAPQVLPLVTFHVDFHEVDASQLFFPTVVVKRDACRAFRRAQFVSTIGHFGHHRTPGYIFVAVIDFDAVIAIAET